MLQGLDTRQKMGTLALTAMVLFVLGVIGSSYFHSPEPFPMSRQEAAMGAPGPGGGGGATGRTDSGAAPLRIGQAISINKASQAELESLPGIGPVKAKAIVDFRNRIGGFKTLEELKSVRGIGDGIYAKVLPFITL